MAEPDASANSKIRQIVESIAETWNRHDMEAFARLFSEDADYVNIGGQHLKGRPEIETHHVRLHSGHYSDSKLSTTSHGVRFVRPDVAIGHIGCDVVYQDGTEKRSTLMTLVLMNDGSRWLITAAQNSLIAGTPVAPAAPR
jgi:uncharacterized protein (TIGR02246 family)